ncbi:MAG TPA: methyltransferase domain-containing protein [Arenimonas sp.]|nr:methyltransferase domain-containing protein [Arenimonas sp.]HPO23966.1 methyltransferase domain-containing protein [Arenimonas sp.]
MNDPEKLAAHNRKIAKTMMQSVFELASDLAGLGIFPEQAAKSRNAMPIHQRLGQIQQAIEQLRADLATLRGPYLGQQLQGLGVNQTSKNLQLHIGSGPYILDGWINLDIFPAQLSTNVLWGLPFTNGQCRYVFLSHLLEHLFYPTDAMGLLKEIHRVLEPGGIVRIVVPDIEQCLRAYQENNAAFFEQRVEHWGAGDGNATRLEHFLSYAGAGPDPAWLFEAHKFGYDFETLERALQRAGFKTIHRSQFMGSEHAALRVDEHSQVASAKFGDNYYSLFVEAQKE